MKLAIALLVAAVLVASASAGESSQVKASASRQCTALRAQIGPTAFGTSFSSFGTCVSNLVPLERQNLGAAISACRLSLDAGSSRFDACVSRFLKDVTVAEQQSLAKAHARLATETSAAKTCRSQQTQTGFAAAHGGKSFAQFYSANVNLANAFGYCVSLHTTVALSSSGSTATNQTPSGAPALDGDNCGGTSPAPSKGDIADRCDRP